MNKKDSLPGPSKRKSSLGLRSWINSGTDDKVGDAPSTSRPQMIQRSNSNLGIPQFNFSTATRIPRVSSTRESHGRRSSSQEPPSVRRNLGVSPNPQDGYMQNVGMLITPVRPTPSRSPGGLSLGSSSRGSIAGRQSVIKMQIPGTASKLKDGRPVSDKMFQTSSMSRIQNFIRSLGVQPPSLKPMSNAALIFSFNSIMGELDPSMKVSTADYIEKIPSYLRALQYPSIISKSSYAAVGSGHAGVQLIAMLAWLLDAVEALQKSDPENVLFPHAETNEEEQLNKAGLKTLFRAYQDFRANEASSTAEDFQDMLCQEMGVSRDAEYQLGSEIESLQQQLEALRNDPRRKESEEKVQILDDTENKMNEVKTQRDQLAEVISTKRAKIQEQKNNITHLDVELSRLDDHIAEIQDRVDCQVMKASERDALREESANLKEQIDHHTDYFDKLQDSVGRIDVEMSQQRKKVGDIIHTINCTVLENGFDEKLKWTMNPVQCENIDSYESSLRHSWENTNQRLLKDIESHKNAIIAEKNEKIKIQAELKEKQEQIRLKTEELKNTEAELKKGHSNCKIQEEKLIVEIEKAKSKCMELQYNLDQYPKLEDLENDIKSILEENGRIVDEQEAFKILQENVYLPQLIEMTDQWQENLADYCGENFK